MRVITDLSSSPWPGERTVVTIGAYDGVHLGHRAVIAEVRRRADEQGARSAVITFDRHPASVVRPESAPKLLTDVDQKIELLAATGVDATVVVHFDEQQSQEAPVDFARRVLVECLSASAVVVGSDFHFGRGRQGNVDTLRALGAECDFSVHPMALLPRTDGPDEPISSTAISRPYRLPSKSNRNWRSPHNRRPGGLPLPLSRPRIDPPELQRGNIKNTQVEHIDRSRPERCLLYPADSINSYK